MAPPRAMKQDVVRMNRDTLYSGGVFDLDAGPVPVTLPDAGKRFMSLQTVTEDHYSPATRYAPAKVTLMRKQVGTRYVALIARTLVSPSDPADVQAVSALQDEIRIEQLGATATGRGLSAQEDAVYSTVDPKANDGKTVHELTVKDVPVDGFWSISVYDAKGYFEKNDLDSYSVNSLAAKPGADGSYTIQLGGCTKDTPNCLVTPAGWNYAVRQYRPRKEILDGTWKFPEAQPVR